MKDIAEIKCPTCGKKAWVMDNHELQIQCEHLWGDWDGRYPELLEAVEKACDADRERILDEIFEIMDDNYEEVLVDKFRRVLEECTLIGFLIELKRLMELM